MTKGSFIFYLVVFIVTFERKYYVSCSQVVPMKGNFLLIVDHTVDLLRNGYWVLYSVKTHSNVTVFPL